jgi:hypothetical protein
MKTVRVCNGNLTMEEKIVRVCNGKLAMEQEILQGWSMTSVTYISDLKTLEYTYQCTTSQGKWQTSRGG